MSNKDKGVVDRAVVTPDKHAPLHDPAAIDVVVQAIEIIKPSIYVDLGDVGEFDGASHWQWRKKRRPPLEYQLPFIKDDISAANTLMDQIDEALDKAGCKKKHFCQGNHDLWLDYFVEENPFLPELAFAKAVRLKKRGYKFHKAGELLKVGKLNFYHGHLVGGIHHARNHLLKLGGNVMYGHWHDAQSHQITHIDGPKAAWCIACLKLLERYANEWLGGRTHNWTHGFAVVDFFEGGLFTVHQIQIVDGRTSLWGEVIRGKKKD